MKKIALLVLMILGLNSFYTSGTTPTGDIVNNKKEKIEFKLDEESYIDDIPFNTEKVALNYYLNTMMSNSKKSVVYDTIKEQINIIDNDAKFNGHWSGLNIGINGYSNDGSRLNLSSEYDYLDLNMKKSINFQFNFLEINNNLIKEKFGIVTGLGLEYNNYRFDDNVVLSKGDNTIINIYDNKINYDKSKLVINYLNLPVLFEYQNNELNKNSFHVSTGIIGGIRIGSHTKLVYNNNDNKEKDKLKEDFYINKFKLDSSVRFGWNKLNFYINYSLLPLFDNNKGPELKPFNIGVSLLSI